MNSTKDVASADEMVVWWWMEIGAVVLLLVPPLTMAIKASRRSVAAYPRAGGHARGNFISWDSAPKRQSLHWHCCGPIDCGLWIARIGRLRRVSRPQRNNSSDLKEIGKFGQDSKQIWDEW